MKPAVRVKLAKLTNREVREIQRRTLAEVPDDDEIADVYRIAQISFRKTLEYVAERAGVSVEELIAEQDMPRSIHLEVSTKERS